MSEFQYYEFHAIDKPLNKKQQAEVREMSSRVRLSARKAVFTYSYSDFRYNEEKVVLDHFDFMFYTSNWGRKRLLMKFPQKMVDYEQLIQYRISVESDYSQDIVVKKKSPFILIDIDLTEGESGGWIEEEEISAYDFLDIRRQILDGDYRGLFLIWVRFLEDKYECEEEELEYEDDDEEYGFQQSLIPPNLSKVDGATSAVMAFFNVNQDWVDTLKMYSQAQKDLDYEALLEKLPADRQLFYLKKVLNNEPNTRTLLRNELKGGQKKKGRNTTPFIELQEIVEKIAGVQTKRLAREKAASEKAYQEKMAKIRLQEEAIQQEIIGHLKGKTGSAYDKALAGLLNLRSMYEHYEEEEQLREFMKEVKRLTSSKPAMKRRLEKKRFI